MKRRMKMLSWLTLVLVLVLCPCKVLASDGTEYITISVDASDDNGNLQYAIDDPSNFSSSNTFTIPAGTSHTIYVKDAAGNITSREYSSAGGSQNVTSSHESNLDTSRTYDITTGTGDQEINIDMELGMKSDGMISEEFTQSSIGDDYKNYEYLTDTVVEESTPAVVQSKTTTDGTDTAEKVFYQITTTEGESFYLIIEQGNSNRVHLLNTVTLDDLKVMAAGDNSSSTGPVSEKEEDNLLEALNSGKTNDEATDGSSPKKDGNKNMLTLLAFILLCGGGFYYFKIYKNKKMDTLDTMDAMDMDEFQPEEDEDDEEIEFDEEEKQQLLDDLIASDEYAKEEELLHVHVNPDEYEIEYGMSTETEGFESTEDSHADTEEKVESPAAAEEIDEEVSKALSAAEEYDEELDSEEE